MPRLSVVCRLPDGARVRVRELLPSDEGALRAAMSDLSAQSRYQRFLRPVHDLPDSLWTYLCAVDGRNHAAIVALPLDERRILGVARFVRESIDARVAEIAVTVVDAWQRRRLGSLLVDLITDVARNAGVSELVAYALPNNVAIRRLLARCGPIRAYRDGIDDSFRIDLRSRRPSSAGGAR